MLNSEDLWEEMQNRGKFIAGPWIPSWSGVIRYNFYGQPLALAKCQHDIYLEDNRLEKLGYKLTDKNEIFPNNMWNLYNNCYHAPMDDSSIG